MYDVKTEIFSFPMHFTDEAAENWFKLLVNTHGMGVTHTNPEDFVIYHLGSFDETTGNTNYLPERKFHNSLTAYRSSKPCKHCQENLDKLLKDSSDVA